jgi:hypothetical protein
MTIRLYGKLKKLQIDIVQVDEMVLMKWLVDKIAIGHYAC